MTVTAAAPDALCSFFLMCKRPRGRSHFLCPFQLEALCPSSPDSGPRRPSVCPSVVYGKWGLSQGILLVCYVGDIILIQLGENEATPWRIR